MSEYKKFLSQFSKAKKKADAEREDVIPLKKNKNKKNPEQISTEVTPEENIDKTAEAQPSADTTESSEKEVTENKVKTTAISEEKASEDKTLLKQVHEDNISVPRFIKTNETPFISVKHAADAIPPTSVEKFTDRLVPQAPGKREHTGYTGKINTYAANHSADAETVKFIPASEEEKEDAVKNAPKKATPKSTAESQTKIFPKSIDTTEAPPEHKVIIEKLDGDSPTKPIEAKSSLLKEIAKTSGAEMGEDPEQLTLEDAVKDEVTAEQAAEDEVLEQELKGVREKRIKNFRFWSKSAEETAETDDTTYSTDSDKRDMPGKMAHIQQKFSHLNSDFADPGCEEFTDPVHRRKIFSALINVKKNVLIKAGIMAILGTVLFIMNISASVSAAMNNGFFKVFGASPIAYNIVNIVFLIAATIVMADDLKKGLFSILKLRPKTDSVLLFMYISALVQNIASFFTLMKPESDYHLMGGAVILLSVPVLLARVFFHDSTRQCFKVISASRDKSYLRKISDSKLIASLLRDNTSEETNVVYAGRTRFINSFIKRSGRSAFASQTSSRTVAASVIISLIAAIIGGVATKSFMFGISTLTLCACLSLPVSCLLAGGYFLSKENTSLAIRHSFIESYSDARDFASVDDIVIRDSDIFGAEVVSSTSAAGVSENQAEYCAAVLASKTDGLLKNAFKEASAKYEDMFPEVEKLIYEDKLGISAWVKDCKVLLGSKEFLKNHSVELPTDDSLSATQEGNCRPLYLAIEGHFASVFSIRYTCRNNVAETLRTLTKGGTNILLTTSDPNIDEGFSEKLLEIPANSLRITDKNAREKINEAKHTVTDSEDAGFVFTDSADSFARTATAAVKLDKIKKASKLINEVVIILSLILVAGLASTGSPAAVSVWLPVILQVIWICLCLFVSPLLVTTGIPSDLHIKAPAKKSRPEPTSDKEEVTPENNDEDIVEEAVNKSSTTEEDESEGNETDEDEFDEDESDEDAIFSRPQRLDIKKRHKRIKEKSSEPEKEESKPVQLKMDMPENNPFITTPPVIDFSKITGDEDGTELLTDKELDELKDIKLTEEILDEFSETPSERRKKRRNHHIVQDEGVQENERKTSFFSHFTEKDIKSRNSSDDKEDFEDDDIFEGPIERKKEKRNEDKEDSPFEYKNSMPPPPHYNLDPVSEEDETDDILDAHFEPPESTGPTAVYDDDYFSLFEPKEEEKPSTTIDDMYDFDDIDI